MGTLILSTMRRTARAAPAVGCGPSRSQRPLCFAARIDAEAYLGVPLTAQLAQNYPNPFNSETVIEYDLPQSGEIQLVIYDIRRDGPAGRLVGQWAS